MRREKTGSLLARLNYPRIIEDFFYCDPGGRIRDKDFPEKCHNTWKGK